MTNRLKTLTLAALMAACGVSPAPLHPTLAPAPVNVCRTACSDSVILTFLGVSGFAIRHSSSVIVTDPSFTHPGLLGVALPWVSLRPNMPAIDDAFAADSVGDAAAILVGHSHYDHLLDVPYISLRWLPNARVYGSESTANMLTPIQELVDRVQVMSNADVGTPEHAGKWFSVPGTDFRIMPLASSHAPNFWHFTMANRLQTEPLRVLPNTAYGWPVGETLAYLIDVLGPDSTPAFRMLFESAAADSALEHIVVLDSAGAHPIDLAIICAGNFGNAADYPTALLTRYHPKNVIVAHWEDFFRPVQAPFVGIPFNDVTELCRRLNAAQGSAWVTPLPGARLVYRYSTGAVASRDSVMVSQQSSTRDGFRSTARDSYPVRTCR